MKPAIGATLLDKDYSIYDDALTLELETYLTDRWCCSSMQGNIVIDRPADD